MKKIIKISFILSVTMIILISGCKNEFEPFTEPEDSRMIFSVLDNRLPFQYVRVQKFYQTSNDAKNKTDIEIFLSENSGAVYKLKDTILQNKNYQYFYLPGYKLKRGLLYRLTVVEDSMVRSIAECNVWQNPILGCLMLPYDDKGETKAFSRIFFEAKCSDYFLFKLFIKYEVTAGNITHSKIAEVPIGINILENEEHRRIEDCSKQNVSVQYTSMMKRGDTSNFTRFDGLEYFSTYNHENIIYALRFLEDKYSRITIKGAMYIFYSIDKNIYENFLKAGKEQYSVRLDEPLYLTNILPENSADAGFFGSITTDTVYMKVPSYFINEFSYVDGQN